MIFNISVHILFLLSRTTPTHPPSIYDCDFESTNCSAWNIVGTSELSWTRVQGSMAAQADMHNAIFDHTENQANGHYLLLQPNQTAPLSNVTKKLRNVCRWNFLLFISSRQISAVDFEVQP